MIGECRDELKTSLGRKIANSFEPLSVAGVMHAITCAIYNHEWCSPCCIYFIFFSQVFGLFQQQIDHLSNSDMRQRERMVVYCRSDHQSTAGQLRIEQVMVQAVDEAEKNAFEKDKMKYLNEELLDTLSDSVVLSSDNCAMKCNMVNNVSSVVDFDTTLKCDALTTYSNISFESVVHADELAKFKNSVGADNSDKFDSSSGTISSYVLTADIDDNASFNLTNLHRSLPRLVIKAPERLHDETSGAFRQYCGVDVSHASLWSARLNSLNTVSRCKPDETDNLLDTSCCSVDSIVTTSSIESGPRTFFDPALHNGRRTHERQDGGVAQRGVKGHAPSIYQRDELYPTFPTQQISNTLLSLRYRQPRIELRSGSHSQSDSCSGDAQHCESMRCQRCPVCHHYTRICRSHGDHQGVSSQPAGIPGGAMDDSQTPGVCDPKRT